MPRVCFTLQVDPSRLDDYRRDHAAVWPEMLRALRDAGWRDYSLHLRDDGLLIGVVDTDDFQASLDAMATTDVNARWQDAMAPYFTTIDDAAPDEAMTVVPQIFHLETQLAAAQEAT